MKYRLGSRVFLTVGRRHGTVVGRISNGTMTAYRLLLDDGERTVATEGTLLSSIVPASAVASVTPCDVEAS